MNNLHQKHQTHTGESRKWSEAPAKDTAHPQQGESTFAGQFASERNCRNPFCAPVRPVPCDPYEAEEYQSFAVGEEPWLDYNVFTPSVISRVFDMNQEWLEARPRTAKEILAVLFPTYEVAAFTKNDVLSAICNALWENGFHPSAPDLDAEWEFPV